MIEPNIFLNFEMNYYEWYNIFPWLVYFNFSPIECVLLLGELL